MKANEKYIIELGDHWRVTVKTPDGRKVKYYSFNKWGGKSASFTLALKWRDEILKKYDLTDRLRYAKSPDFSFAVRKFIRLSGFIKPVQIKTQKRCLIGAPISSAIKP